MKLFFTYCLTIGLLAFSAFGQSISKPTKSPSPPTPAQERLISEGIELHDAGKFDEAIKKYEAVLVENPNCTFAMYEMTLSYSAKKDDAKALEVALIGSKYDAPELGQFYIAIANILDDRGDGKKAVSIYNDAIKILKENKNTQALASVYYNLGVSQTRQKLYKEARESLKGAIENNFSYASPHALLSEIFSGTRYKVPAMLAATRLVSVELNTARTKRAVGLILAIMQPASKDPKTGNISINLDFGAPTDEGEYGMYEMLLPTLTTIKDKTDEKKSEEELFASAFDTLVSMLAEDKKLGATFVGRNYVPFFLTMKQKGFTKHMAYLILQQNGNEAAEKWLVDSGPKTVEFLTWSKSFRPAK